MEFFLLTWPATHIYIAFVCTSVLLCVTMLSHIRNRKGSNMHGEELRLDVLESFRIFAVQCFVCLKSYSMLFLENWQANIRGGDPWAGKNKYRPCLLYGLECYNLPKSALRSLDFAVARFLIKLFKTVNNALFMTVVPISDFHCQVNC